MTIVVEDGTIVAGANSYVSEAELTAYATARGLTITGDKEVLLTKAMDYIESLSYIGIRWTRDQNLQWPRSNVYIDGYYQNVDSIPKELKHGLMEVAIAIFQGNDPQAEIARQKSSVKVGSLAVTYESGQSTTMVRRIINALYKIISGGLGGGSFKVGRG